MKGNNPQSLQNKVAISSEMLSEYTDSHGGLSNPSQFAKPSLKDGWGGLLKLHMEYSERVIDTLDEFLTVAGFEIYSDEGEEVHLKVKSTNKIIKVRRDLFTKYSTPESSRIEEEENEDDDYSIMIKTESAGIKEIAANKLPHKHSSREIKGGKNNWFLTQ